MEQIFNRGAEKSKLTWRDYVIYFNVAHAGFFILGAVTLVAQKYAMWIFSPF